MKRFSVLTLILTCGALQAQDYWCLNSRVSIFADYGYMRRQEGRDLSLVKETEVFRKHHKKHVKLKTVMDTDDLIDRFKRESAIRGGITYHSDECASLEALYTYFYPWHSHKTVTGRKDLSFPFKVTTGKHGFVDADRAEGTYRSRLQNGELNLWNHLTPQRVNYFSASWILGYRMMYLKERIILEFIKEHDRSFYTIRTKNHLYGLQLGAVLEMNPYRWLTWTFIAKGSGFLDVAENRVFIGEREDAKVIAEYSKKRWTDSYLLEGYGQITYHWSSYLDIHFAYQGFILTGVALAPAQRNVEPIHHRFNKDSQIVIDGFYAGIDLSY